MGVYRISPELVAAWARGVAPEIKKILDSGEFREISGSHLGTLWEKYGGPVVALVSQKGKITDEDRRRLQALYDDLVKPRGGTTIIEIRPKVPKRD